MFELAHLMAVCVKSAWTSIYLLVWLMHVNA